MPRKTTLTALITAATILSHVPAASAAGWNMSWFTFGYSAGGIVLNGKSLDGRNRTPQLQSTSGGFRITVARPPAAPAPFVPTPLPNTK